jgi:hypothetical protein
MHRTLFILVLKFNFSKIDFERQFGGLFPVGSAEFCLSVQLEEWSKKVMKCVIFRQFLTKRPLF